MKKKYIILTIVLIIVIIIISVIFNKNSNKVNEVEEAKSKVVKSLGKTTDKRIIVKLLNEKDEESYYLFIINNMGYEQYCYRFFNKEEDYNNWVKKYSSPNYKLETNDKALMVKIYAQSGHISTDESLYDTLTKKYSDNNKYQIIK